MKGFVWYSPELNVLVIQWAYNFGSMDHFEWHHLDLGKRSIEVYPDDPIQSTTWFPLGEL